MSDAPIPDELVALARAKKATLPEAMAADVLAEIGDVERSLLYALANHRASRVIIDGVDQQRLRPEIREATYDEFEKAKSL